jgi:hypothetical protein
MRSLTLKSHIIVGMIGAIALANCDVHKPVAPLGLPKAGDIGYTRIDLDSLRYIDFNNFLDASIVSSDSETVMLVDCREGAYSTTAPAEDYQSFISSDIPAEYARVEDAFRHNVELGPWELEIDSDEVQRIKQKRRNTVYDLTVILHLWVSVDGEWWTHSGAFEHKVRIRQKEYESPYNEDCHEQGGGEGFDRT